jgi:hypothetical protein
MRMPRLERNKRDPHDLAEDLKEPMGFAETGALAFAALHEAVGRAAEKIADEGRKFARRARRRD